MSGTLDYSRSPKPRSRIPNVVAIIVIVGVLSAILIPDSIRNSSKTSVDPITGSILLETRLFFGPGTQTVTVSALELRLKSSGIAWTPTWHFLSESQKGLGGYSSIACALRRRFTIFYPS